MEEFVSPSHKICEAQEFAYGIDVWVGWFIYAPILYFMITFIMFIHWIEIWNMEGSPQKKRARFSEFPQIF